MTGRWLVIGIVGLLLLAGAGCKRKEYPPPALGTAAGDSVLGGAEAQRIQVWTQIDQSSAAPGNAANVDIIARVENGSGWPMPDGTMVVWLASQGSLNNATTTTTDGITSVTLTFPKNYADCSWVTAISGRAKGGVWACAQVAQSTITITSSKTETSAVDSVTVTVRLASNGKPDVGYQVTFSLTQASVVATQNDASAKLTDGNGEASTQINMKNTGATDVLVTVKAETADNRNAEIEILVRKP